MPEREVELRLDDLAGLADLLGVRDPARVDRRARRPDRAAERLGELLDELEPLGAADAATAGDDDPRLLDRRPRRPPPRRDRRRGPRAAPGRRTPATSSTVPGARGGSAVTAFGRTVMMPPLAGEGALRDELAAEHAHLDDRPIVRPAGADRVGEDAQPGQRRERAGDVAAVRARAGSRTTSPASTVVESAAAIVAARSPASAARVRDRADASAR